MLELYQGLSRYDGSLCATFALSDTVKRGFATDDPDYRHAKVSLAPEYLLIDIALLDDVLDEHQELMIYELGIRLDQTLVKGIQQMAREVSKRPNGLDSLPQSHWRNTIRLKALSPA